MKNNDLFYLFQTQLLALAPASAHFKIALSGGLDSVVLVHLFSRLEKSVSTAHHVHHGLSDNADKWVVFCTDLCASLTMPLQVSHVILAKKSRISLEALAREKRYAVLKEGFNDKSYLVTAHHQDDQLETVLLALKRGAGLAGLQGIVAKQSLSTGHLIRPLLHFSREQLEHYAQQFSLQWMEDESNRDQQFDRNFIRHRITPLLKQRWPAIAKTVARSAQHCQTQLQLINELTDADFKHCQLLPLQLKIMPLKALTETRRNNVLRYWFKQAAFHYPSSKQLSVIWQDLVLAQRDAQPKIQLQQVTVFRYQAVIYLVDERCIISKPQKIEWQGETQKIVDAGRFQLQIDVKNDFLRQSHQIEICFREQLNAGFQCHPIGRGKARSIKKLLHEYQV
ncbi:MAG: tRNA lysidine(34) synthetase TilS, partial [Psychromonas sp.]